MLNAYISSLLYRNRHLLLNPKSIRWYLYEYIHTLKNRSYNDFYMYVTYVLKFGQKI